MTDFLPGYNVLGYYVSNTTTCSYPAMQWFAIIINEHRLSGEKGTWPIIR